MFKILPQVARRRPINMHGLYLFIAWFFQPWQRTHSITFLHRILVIVVSQILALKEGHSIADKVSWWRSHNTGFTRSNSMVFKLNFRVAAWNSTVFDPHFQFQAQADTSVFIPQKPCLILLQTDIFCRDGIGIGR